MDTIGAREIPFREALRVWIRIALLSFGGPAGQIAVMHRILVEEKRWFSERRFLHALNYCMLLPGPEAQQLAIYAGWLLHGYRGGIVAGVLFVLPGFLSIFALSLIYAIYQDVDLVTALFFGLKAAVLAIVLFAVFRIGRRVLRQRANVVIAAASFLALFLLTVPFPAVVLGAALVGLIGHRLAPASFEAAELHGDADDDSVIGDAIDTPRASPTLGRAGRVLAICGGLWFAPTIVLTALFGWDSVWSQLARFFSQAAVVTFGGAYAVLAYIAQEAVATHGWLAPGEMLDGLGMAETTPGPLIQVVQFVGFMGAYRDPGALDPILAASLAAVLVTWVTFAPCFLWIFLGAPYVEALRGARALNVALTAVTAAVVGAILNLAIWFAIHVLFEDVSEERSYGVRLLIPELRSLDVPALVLSAGAFVAVFRYKVGTLPVLGVSALAGMAYWMLIRA